MKIGKYNSDLLEQLRSFASIKTSVLIAFIILWNLGFLIALYGFGDGFGYPMSPRGGIVISITCFSAFIFSACILFSPKIREKLLESSRAHNYREKHFYIFCLVSFSLSVVMLVVPGLNNV